MPIEFGDEEYVIECVREPGNRHDNMAVLVKEEGRGEDIGRVPRYICNVISEGFRRSEITRAFCLYTGTHHNEGPVPGGGVKLHCVYVLEYSEITERRLADVANYLKNSCA